MVAEEVDVEVQEEEEVVVVVVVAVEGVVEDSNLAMDGEVEEVEAVEDVEVLQEVVAVVALVVPELAVSNQLQVKRRHLTNSFAQSLLLFYYSSHNCRFNLLLLLHIIRLMQLALLCATLGFSPSLSLAMLHSLTLSPPLKNTEQHFPHKWVYLYDVMLNHFASMID